MRISDWSSDVCSSDLHWALLRRQMRFGTIALLETSAELTAAAIAIALAWHGAGYWALVVQRLLAAALMLLGSWLLCAWRPGLTITTTGLRDRERKSVVEGKRWAGRVNHGGCRS